MSTPKIASVVSFPALPWREVSSFMTQLHAREGVAAGAVEFAILTAYRSREIRGAAWDEIDLEARV